MAGGIMSGKEILDDFFGKLGEIPEVDSEIVQVIQKLYAEDKLTQTNLSNALLNLREGKSNDKD